MAAAASSSSSSSSETSPPLGKYLASTDKKTRDKAIKSLTAFLSTDDASALPKSEMAKLWKGIFYCFWMSDKPLVQQTLATEIAEILLVIPHPSSSLAFLRGFWEATVREWAGIDRLRIDKYYMLIRRFTNASFRLLLRENWDSALSAEYNAILTDHGGPLCPEDVKVPPSIPYHLADIYLEELDKAVLALSSSSSASSPPPTPLSTLLHPFFALAARTSTKMTVQRIESALLEPLFDALDSSSHTEQDEDNENDNEDRARKRLRLSGPAFPHIISNACLASEGALSAGALQKGLLKRLFEVASEEQTKDANRRKMYKFWKTRAGDDENE
ncbi:Nop52-domain-containing protein [Cytidiella melzeri]|nr:Nop52-domain-containing protein [Cytidiella melzeri]